MKTFIAVLLLCSIAMYSTQAFSQVEVEDICKNPNVENMLVSTTNNDDDELEKYCEANPLNKQYYVEAMYDYFNRNMLYFTRLETQLCTTLEIGPCKVESFPKELQESFSNITGTITSMDNIMELTCQRYSLECAFMKTCSQPIVYRVFAGNLMFSKEENEARSLETKQFCLAFEERRVIFIENWLSFLNFRIDQFSTTKAQYCTAESAYFDECTSGKLSDELQEVFTKIDIAVESWEQTKLDICNKYSDECATIEGK